MRNINPHYNDCYFSEEGGLEESVWVFVKGNKFNRFTSSHNIYVGETGFGSGLNLIALIDWINNEIKRIFRELSIISAVKNIRLILQQQKIFLIPLFIKKKGQTL